MSWEPWKAGEEIAAPIEVRWCWCLPDGEDAHGPFDSRADAIADAAECFDDGQPHAVVVGVADPLRVRGYASSAADLDRVLELMDDCARDAGEGPEDDAAFEVSDADRVDAEAALALALESWAQKWVRPVAWFTMRDGERVTV